MNPFLWMDDADLSVEITFLSVELESKPISAAVFEICLIARVGPKRAFRIGGNDIFTRGNIRRRDIVSRITALFKGADLDLTSLTIPHPINRMISD